MYKLQFALCSHHIIFIRRETAIIIAYSLQLATETLFDVTKYKYHMAGLRNCFGPLTTRVCLTSGETVACACSGNVPTIAALVDRADNKLFESVLHNPHHVGLLNNLMSDETVCSYELRHRRHNREHINKTSRLVDSDFIIHIIYKDMY